MMSRGSSGDWETDLARLKECYRTWDDLAQALDADVTAKHLSKMYNGRAKVRHDLREAIKDHRDKIASEHVIASEVAAFCVQLLQWIISNIEFQPWPAERSFLLLDVSKDELEAKKKTIRRMSKKLMD